MTSPRIVLDTNILLSSLVFKTVGAAWVRSAWQSGALIPLVNRETVTELLRVLGYPKFSLAEDEIQDLLADYLPWCETVSDREDDLRIPTCRDPFDRAFLALCLVGKADALVTGDRDLLVLKDVFPVPILTLPEFKELLER